MNLTIALYQKRSGGALALTTIGLGPHTQTVHGKNPVKLQRRLAAQLKQLLPRAGPRMLERLLAPRTLTLERLHLELKLAPGRTGPEAARPGMRAAAGLFPFVVETRRSGEVSWRIAYHPLRPEEWVPVDGDRALAAQVAPYLARAWAHLDHEDVDELRTTGKDRLSSFGFDFDAPSPLDRLPERPRSPWEEARRARRRRTPPIVVLGEVATDDTVRAATGSLPPGMPRAGVRQELARLLGGERREGRQSLLVVGEAGSGRATAIDRWVHDRLVEDGWEAHRNLDRVHHVWAFTGRRLIAGMTHLGDWEERCLRLLDEASHHRVLLRIDDLCTFGRLGQSRDSARRFADAFRGPVGRGDVTVVGRATPEELRLLEQDAPSFAALFTKVHLDPATPAECRRMLLHDARRLELERPVAFAPDAYRTVLDLAGVVLPGTSSPGRELEVLRELARRAPRPEEGPARIHGTDVVKLLSERSGLQPDLLDPRDARDPALVEEALERRVMGQEAGVRAAADLVARVRARMTDDARPFAVCLFTGPTGTGKTELASTIAEYLYGERGRLLRLDMGELSGHDAVARLIGTRGDPEGLLTSPLMEQPFSVLLLDEIEKAHPDVFNLLLQLLDEGRITDAAGQVVTATRAVVLMTSNIGAAAGAAPGLDGDADVAGSAARAVEAFFAPELFNRIDRIVAFGPLPREAARRIAGKELSRLLARSGLVDRHVMVTCPAATLARVVEEGFDPIFGARTVKRYLEDHVARALTDALAGAPAARARRLRVLPAETARGASARPGAARFDVTQEALLEAEPLRGWTLRLEPLLDRPAKELAALLPGLLDDVDALLASPAVAALSARASAHLARHNLGEVGHADRIYHLQALVGGLRALRGRMGQQRSARAPDRERILDAVADLEHLRRAVDLVDDPEEHSVIVHLTRVGMPQGLASLGQGAAGEGLLPALVRTYAGGIERGVRGKLEGFALRRDDGALHRDDGASELGGSALDRVRRVVLRVSGLGIRDALRFERGSHIWESSAGSEVVLVDLRGSADDLAAAAHLARIEEAAARFAAALEAGTRPLPADPDALLPIVRRLRFEPPVGRGAGTGLLEVEDHVLSHAEALRVRTLDAAIPRLLALSASRRPPGPRP